MSGLAEMLTRADLGHAPPTARWPGVYPALVTDLVDPDGQGRVQVSLPWSPDEAGGTYQTWARLCTLMGGPNRGSWFIPEHGDEVLVAFEAGDPRRPYVLGGLWNGSDAPPQTMDSAGNNYKKVLKTRNGVTVTLDDTDGSEQLMLQTPGGQQLTLQDGPGSVTLQDANGNQVTLDPSGITVNAAAPLTVNAASATIAAATLTVNAGISTFSGVVQADTVLTNSVISASYTPGAGNIW
ncbi:MAG TPA: phage baseplate assembly protein V [Solirubrobacteraceae bacterium]|nr:phage baseplate assembly protein V [Solirubrobacteraceae bacterium]